MKTKVLIVDDDPSLIHTVEKILERAGIQTEAAFSGKECIKALENGFRGLILMDIIMPEMDGWDTIQEIIEKDLHQDVLICMLTGKEEPDEKMNTLKEFVLDYIRKPIDTHNFLEVVQGYLQYIK